MDGAMFKWTETFAHKTTRNSELYEAAEVVDAQAREESRTDSSNSLCSRSPWLRSSCAGTH